MISFQTTTTFATTSELYFASTSRCARAISQPPMPTTEILIFVVWRRLKSRCSTKTSRVEHYRYTIVSIVNIGRSETSLIHAMDPRSQNFRILTSPFALVPNSCQFVSYADENIVSSNARRRRRRTANKLSRKDSIGSSYGRTMTPPFVLPTTPVETEDAIVNTTTYTSALSVVLPVMAPALENASETIDVTTEDLFTSSWPKYLPALSFELRHFITSIPFDITDIPPPPKIFYDNLSPPEPTSSLDHDFSRTNTPYNASAFFAYLYLSGLLPRYPELPFKLTFGFAIGAIPPIFESYCPPNLPSALPHSTLIRESIESDIALRRLSSPYTKAELESKIGPFRSSPIQVSSKFDAPGAPPKWCVCRNLSFRGILNFSVNDCIDAAAFPTRWDTAILCASIVSVISIISSRPLQDRQASRCDFARSTGPLHGLHIISRTLT